MEAFLKTVKEIFNSAIKNYSSITAKDIVDILLVTIVLFLVLKFIRDRRAGKLILGIIVLGIIEVICDFFNMSTMKYILQVIFQNGVLAMVVIFQPELRSLLEVVADPLKNLKFGLNEGKDGQEIHELIIALRDGCCSMAKEKTGALIVIERDTKLGDAINSGTKIDSRPSASLIKNIFFKNSPLHDGAMVIRGGRLYAAGCFLPLSPRNDIDRDLGTRHRAAIGMSEASDAVVIVVSEETGAISIASGGKIKRNFDYTTLQTYLTSILMKPQKAKKRSHRGKEEEDFGNEAERK